MLGVRVDSCAEIKSALGQSLERCAGKRDLVCEMSGLRGYFVDKCQMTGSELGQKLCSAQQLKQQLRGN